MSDAPRPEETPAEAPLTEVPISPTEASAKGGPAPSRPPVDYALPTQKKSWLPTPALIRNLGCLFKLIVGFTVLICMGYFALVALNPKAREWALQGTKPGPGGAPPSGKGPTPFKFINQILAIPAQALGKTDDVVKANNARVGQLDRVISEEEKAKAGKSGHAGRPVVDPFATPSAVGGTSRPDKGTPEGADNSPQSISAAALLALAEKQAAANPSPTDAPSAPAEAKASPPLVPQGGTKEAPDEMKLAGDIVIAQAPPAGAPRASAAFFYSIVKLNISGITQGKPARALINNRLTYEGDEINRPLGITFAELDAANKLLVFRDRTGATVTRSY